MVVVVILFVCLFVFNLELLIYGEGGGLGRSQERIKVNSKYVTFIGDWKCTLKY